MQVTPDRGSNAAVGVAADDTIIAAPQPWASAATVVVAPGSGNATLSAAMVDVSQRSVAASRAQTLGQLVAQSATALAVMAIVAMLLGLFVARRVLRPVQAITTTARRLGEGTLDERLTVSGPHDGLRQLAETFNAMLDRLQAAFRRERRLMANVSHELRTPLPTSASRWRSASPTTRPRAPSCGAWASSRSARTCAPSVSSNGCGCSPAPKGRPTTATR